MEFKSIAENEIPPTIDTAKYIRSRIEENYHKVLQQIEDGTWDKLSIGHLKALRYRCNQELRKRGVKDEVDYKDCRYKLEGHDNEVGD